MRIFDATLTILERSLDVRLARHSALSGNLANIDTPGYVPKDIDVTDAMVSGEPAALAVSAAMITGERDSVDLDRTMATLAENGMQYGAGARAAGKKLAILRYVATDGNG